MAMTDDKKEARKLRAALSDLTTTVRAGVKHIDALMLKERTAERDGEVAKVMNTIEMANDRARFFALDQRRKGRSP